MTNRPAEPGDSSFSRTIPSPCEGQRIEQNRSRFAAFGGPCGSAAEAAELVRSLTGAHRLSKASHISWAARFREPDGHVTELKGDGGENGAGTAILEVMRSADAGGCLVLVARWYGGRHLGGARFRIYRSLAAGLMAGAAVTH